MADLARVVAATASKVLRIAPHPEAGGAGWTSLEAATAAFAEAAQSPPAEGEFLGVTWPRIELQGRLVSPGVPVVATSHEAEAEDASYRYDGQTLWREAGGVVAAAGLPRPPADEAVRPALLWFDHSARWVVRGPELEVDDLFGSLRLPLAPETLSRLLVRGRRAEPTVVDGIAAEGATLPPTVRVARPTPVVEATTLATPATLLGTRPDLADVATHGDTVEAKGRWGRVVWRTEEVADGFVLHRQDGTFPYRRLELRLTSSAVAITAAVDPSLDPLAPGNRGRLVFDLRAMLTEAPPEGV